MEKLVFINYICSMVLLLCFLFLYFGTTPASCTSNETDFSALLAFKNRIDDDPFGSLRSWNETEHFCDWKGIFCSRRHRGRVVSINLMSQGLVGSVSPYLEYGTTNTMTIQGDVYSFGILVMEMFTNIRPTDNASLNGRSSLHHFVSQDMSYIMNQIFLHEDTNNSTTRDCVTRILEIGVACSLEFPKHRMMMADVVRELNKIQKAYLAG